jgi:hypothetical protein
MRSASGEGRLATSPRLPSAACGLLLLVVLVLLAADDCGAFVVVSSPLAAAAAPAAARPPASSRRRRRPATAIHRTPSAGGRAKNVGDGDEDDGANENGDGGDLRGGGGGGSSVFFRDDGDPCPVEDLCVSPHPSLTARDVVATCLTALIEYGGEFGLRVCRDFSSDRCRAALLGGSPEQFSSEYAGNPVLAHLVECGDWRVLSEGPVIAGTRHRGDMQTILIAATRQKKDRRREEPVEEKKAGGDDGDGGSASAAAGERRFLWTLQKERRPPLQDCWIIHEVLYTENAFQQTL